MPLAYYSRSADSDFWTEHWGTHSVEELPAYLRRAAGLDLRLTGDSAGGSSKEPEGAASQGS